MGRSRPERGRVEVLFRAQVVHAAINARTSASMVEHQNRRWMKSKVRVIPGWQVSLEEWAQTSTLDRTASGTNKRFGGRGLAAVSARGVPRTECECGDLTSGGQDGFGISTGVLGGVQAGQGNRLNVLGPGTVGEGEIETTKE